jgi:hypothetical protein
MAYWLEIIRDKPFFSLTAVATAAVVAWFAAALWGSAGWVAVSVLVLTCIALFPWYLGLRDTRARAAADTFSFGDVVVRMRAKVLAKDQAEAIITARRHRERILAAGQPTS